MRTGRICTGFLAILLLALFATSTFATTIEMINKPEALKKEETREDVTGISFLPVQVNLKEGLKLSPKEPNTLDNEVRQAVASTTKRTGLFGYGILPLSFYQWKLMGTWKTEPLAEELIINGKVTYKIWLFRPSGRSTNGNMRFTLTNADQDIPGTLREVGLGTIEEEVPKEITVTFDVGGNVTPVGKGDILGMRIESAAPKGIYMLYNSAQFRSGVMLTCNSLRVQTIKYEKADWALTVQISDSFGISPTLLNPTLLMDAQESPIDFEMGINMDNFYWELTYFLYLWDDLSSGTYTAQVIFSYTKAAPANVTAVLPLKYEKPPGPGFLDTIEPQNICPFIFIAMIITLVIVLTRLIKSRRRKKGLDGLIGKPGGFWDRQRQKRALKKEERKRKKAAKKNAKALKKQMKKNRRRR